MSKKKSKSFIGIDVAKAQLEVAVHESDYKFRCANKISSFGQLIAELMDLRPVRHHRDGVLDHTRPGPVFSAHRFNLDRRGCVEAPA